MNDQEHKHILILSASYGAGHTSAAKALVAHLEAAGYTATHRDILSFVPTWQAALLRAPYTFTVRHIPWLYGIIFGLIRYQPFLKLLQLSYAPLIILKKRAIQAFIEEVSPDYIICTHFIWTDILDTYSKRWQLPPYYVCITDYNYHPIWKGVNAAGYLVGSTEVADSCTDAGISKNSISITGIPVDPKFRAASDEKKTQITVLLGGHTLIVPTKIIKTTAEAHPETPIVVICGKNKRITHRLTRQLTTYPNITILGWVDNVYAHLHRSTYVISKTGGLTTTECIVAGVPIEPTKPIPGQETSNYHLLKNRGLLYGQAEKNTDGLPVFTIERLPFLKD